MSLSKNDCARLARAFRWARRRGGWTHDVYPGAWRSRDERARVRVEYDELVVECSAQPWHDSRVARVPVTSAGQALDVLVALGVLPAEHSRTYTMGRDDLARQLLAAADQALFSVVNS